MAEKLNQGQILRAEDNFYGGGLTLANRYVGNGAQRYHAVSICILILGYSNGSFVCKNDAYVVHALGADSYVDPYRSSLERRYTTA